jgi:DNA-binding GntR family transcriptional regulator
MRQESNVYPPPTQREIAFQKIREGILLSKWSPGSRLVERQLCREFGVSRTPVREAFNQLAKEGLVELVPQWGVFVKKLRKEEILEMYEVRGALERLAINLAADRATSEDIKRMESSLTEMREALSRRNYGRLNTADNMFHLSIIQASHNKKLIEMASMCQLHVFNMPGDGQAPDSAEQEKSLTEHARILEHLTNKNWRAAEKTLRAHLRNARDKTERHFVREQ